MVLGGWESILISYLYYVQYRVSVKFPWNFPDKTFPGKDFLLRNQNLNWRIKT